MGCSSRTQTNSYFLLKAAVHSSGFIHRDLTCSNLERRDPDLNSERILDAEHFRGENTFRGHLAERRVNGIKGQIRGGRDKPLQGGDLIEFFVLCWGKRYVICSDRK